MEMNIPGGYKQIEVAIIPDAWEIKQLGEIGEVSSGGTPNRSNSSYWNGNIPWITTTQIDFNTIVSANEFITEIGLKNSSAKKYAANTLLMAMYGQGKTRGKVAILGIDATINQACAAITLNKDVFNKYVFFYFAHNYEEIRKLSNTGNQENLNGNIIKSIFVPIPPLSEQKAIAQSLSDVDALIAALDQLITKKRNIKQGTMQQLLTGKKRLPSFRGEWEVKKLEKVAPLQRGFDLPNSQLVKGNYPVVYSNGILNFHNKYQAKAPGVVTGRSGTIGKVTFVEEDYWPHNTSLWVTDFKANAPKFIYYLYVFIGLERFGTGSGVPTLNRNDVHAFQIPLPPTQEEQQAIAQVLSDMDAEIESLEQKRDKYKAIKQGMMQELLTGKTRLIDQP